VDHFVLGRDRPPAAPGRLLRSPLLTAVFVLAALGAAAFVYYDLNGLDLNDLDLVGPTTAVRLALATAVAAPWRCSRAARCSPGGWQ
jgi:hypothetical protein